MVKRMSHRPAILMAAWSVLAVVMVAMARLAFIEADNARLTNYAVACIPVVLTILIAFVPDLRRAHVGWRIAIVAIGLAWSFLLWRQQVLTDKSQADAFMKVDTQVGMVRDDLRSASGQIGTLREDVRTLATQVLTSTSALGDSISKVGKREPTEPVRITLSFYPEGNDPFPVLLRAIAASKDKIYTLPFTVKNVSSLPFKNGDIWIEICSACKYAKEPESFVKESGSSDQIRHRMIQLLNPGVQLSKTLLDITLDQPNGEYNVEVGFAYSCGECGNAETWKQKIIAHVMHSSQ